MPRWMTALHHITSHHIDHPLRDEENSFSVRSVAHPLVPWINPRMNGERTPRGLCKNGRTIRVHQKVQFINRFNWKWNLSRFFLFLSLDTNSRYFCVDGGLEGGRRTLFLCCPGCERAIFRCGWMNMINTGWGKEQFYMNKFCSVPCSAPCSFTPGSDGTPSGGWKLSWETPCAENEWSVLY